MLCCAGARCWARARHCTLALAPCFFTLKSACLGRTPPLWSCLRPCGRRASETSACAAGARRRPSPRMPHARVPGSSCPPRRLAPGSRRSRRPSGFTPPAGYLLWADPKTAQARTCCCGDALVLLRRHAVAAALAGDQTSAAAADAVAAAFRLAGPGVEAGRARAAGAGGCWERARARRGRRLRVLVGWLPKVSRRRPRWCFAVLAAGLVLPNGPGECVCASGRLYEAAGQALRGQR